MQIEVFFPGWRYALESLETGERCIKQQIRELEEQNISIRRRGGSAMRAVAGKLEEQQEALQKQYESLRILKAALERIQKAYESAEDAILRAAEPESSVCPEEPGMIDLEKLNQMVSAFFG